MREKVDGDRAEAEIRVNDERTRVSTKTKAKTEALDIDKARYAAKAKEITQVDKYAIKAKAKVKA